MTAQALQRRADQRRYPILLTLLAQSAVDVLDEVLLLFDQAISDRGSAAKQKVTEASLAERAKGRENRSGWCRSCLGGPVPTVSSRAGGAGLVSWYSPPPLHSASPAPIPDLHSAAAELGTNACERDEV